MIPSGLETWEVVTISALAAACTLSIATTIGATVAYFATREPRAAEQSVTSSPRATEPAYAARPAVSH